MRTLAGWCVGHRRLVVLFWFALLIGSIALVESDRHRLLEQLQLPPHAIVRRHQPVEVGRAGTLGRQRADRLRHVGRRTRERHRRRSAHQQDGRARSRRCRASRVVASPYDSAGNLVNTPNINSARTVGWIPVNFDKQPNNITNAEAKHYMAIVTGTSGDGLTVSDTGPLAENANNQSFSSTGLGVLLALIVLLLVFGSIFAALLPIISALFALGTAIGVIGVLEPCHRHALHLTRAHAPHRPGRRRRLRALHRHPTSPGTRRRHATPSRPSSTR